ncbi:hypothetical protein ACQ4M3_00920 [Leptolyngbya sp. AN03gr2]|uniref:hypothetical protein n=1 Tax=unclassified Leptolyngbya TaxID=2650499 RepID=UPI003D31B60A
MTIIDLPQPSATDPNVDPSRISMMVVPVFERTGTSVSSKQTWLYDAYSLWYPGLPSVSIQCDVADKKMKQWTSQGYGYRQQKWFLWQELNGCK